MAVVCSTFGSWSCNLVILETIFDNLDFCDLKSVSLVCKTWCLGATKAFEQKVHPTIENSSSTTALRHGVERFRRHKNLTLNFDGKPDEAASSALFNSDLSFLTQLNLHFEGTVEIVSCINEILSHLTSGLLPQLQHLELHPYGDTEWDPMEVPSVSSDSDSDDDDDQVASALSMLKVLKVAVGHPSTLGLDWNFLKYLTQLKELHAVDLNFKDGNFGPQLLRFTNHLRGNLPSKLDLHIGILWCNAENYSRNWTYADNISLRAFFEAVKPFTFSVILQTYYADRPLGTAWLMTDICDKVPAASLSRFAIELPICGHESSTFAYINMFFVVNTLYRTYQENTKMTVFVTLNVDFGNHGQTFIELEATAKGLCLRSGSLFDRRNPDGLKNLSKFMVLAWSPYEARTSFDTLRTYRFGKDGSMDRRQYHPDTQVQLPFWDLPSEKKPWRQVEFTEPRVTFSQTSTRMKACEMSLCELYTSEQRFF